MINWQYYPMTNAPTDILLKVKHVFESNLQRIDSSSHGLDSNGVLNVIAEDLKNIGFEVEKGKAASQKIRIPVLFGRNGKLEKSFDADAYSKKDKVVIEVEAGRGVTNHQFLKDLFEACVMNDVEYLVISVRNTYRKKNDFKTVTDFLDAIYASRKIQLPLSGVMIIGY